MDRTFPIPLPAKLDNATAMSHLNQLSDGLCDCLRQSIVAVDDKIEIDEPPLIDDTYPDWHRHIHFRRGWRHGLTLTLRWDFRNKAPQAELSIGRATRIHDTLGLGLTVPFMVAGALPGLISGRKWRFAIGLAVGGIVGMALCMVLGTPLAAIALVGTDLQHQALADEAHHEIQRHLTRSQPATAKPRPGAVAA